MGFISRLLGRGKAADDKHQPPATPDTSGRLSLQLALQGPLPSPQDCLSALRAFHPSMAQARFEIEMMDQGFLVGLAEWGPHAIRLVGFGAPMPAEVVEKCVAPAHYGQELKQSIRRHQSHILLYYAGKETDTLQQFVSLAAVAGAFSGLGVIAAFNESARTSFPAAALAPDEDDGDAFEFLASLPLLILYCGFVKYEVEGEPGVWMRTYGANNFHAHDLAVHAAGHHEGERYFNLFENILHYQIESSRELAEGHTMQMGEDVYIRFSSPLPDQDFLDSPSGLLVVTPISRSEIASPEP